MYQFHRGQDLLKLCEQHNMSIAEIMLQAEAGELGWEAERVRSHIETSRGYGRICAKRTECRNKIG